MLSYPYMSLHIESNQEVLQLLQNQRRRNMFGAAAVTLLGVLLACLIFYLVKIIIPAPLKSDIVAYTLPDLAPPSDDPPPPEPQRHTPTSAAGAPTTVKVVVADAPAPLAMPKVDFDVPDTPAMLDDGVLMGIGDGFGNDLGDSVSQFGGQEKVGSALTGTFYDSKQTPGGKPTGMTAGKYREFIARFVNGEWNESHLKGIYQAPKKLYAAQWYVPRTPAQDAPKAYGCEDRVKPGMWMAIYRGRVRAPKDGTFRFVGLGDDYLAVRFNRQTVLDYGWESATLGEMTANTTKWLDAMEDKPGHEEAKKKLAAIGVMRPPVTFYRYGSSAHWNNTMRGVAAGKTFKVKQGEVYPIEILVSEGPGGEFGMTLLIEEVGMPTPLKDTATGHPVLPLFRTNYGVPTPDKSKEFIPFDEIGIVWEVVE